MGNEESVHKERSGWSNTMESEPIRNVMSTRARRGLPMQQQLAGGGYVVDEVASRNQQLGVTILKGLHMEPYSIVFCNVPRRQRSKRRDLRKRMPDIVDLGHKKDGEMQEGPSKAGGKSNKHSTKIRKCKADSEDYTTRSRVSRKQKDRSGTGKRKSKADSSDSEIYVPRLRARGQGRALLHHSNSITEPGLFDSETFQGYFEKIWTGISKEKRNSFAYLDSLWFNMYTRDCFKENVLKWIKRKNVFSKKYVLVPIVMWSHWSLLILCNFGEESKSTIPCMVLLDSLQAANNSLEPQIRKFVLELYKMEDRPANRESIRKIPLLIPKVPQQKNGEECGSYVLFYVSLFLENAPEIFSISDGCPYFMKEDWFTVQNLDNFRQRLGAVSAESSN